MKRGRDGEAAEADFRGREGGLEFFDFGDWAGNDGLARAVVVGYDAAGESGAEERGGFRRGLEHGGHRTGVVLRDLGHEFSTATAGAEKIVGVEHTGGVEGNEFAVAVAGGERGLDAGGAEDGEVGKADGAECGLGVFRATEDGVLRFGFGRSEGGCGIDEIAEPRDSGGVERGDLLPRGHGGREVLRELGGHADGLAALAGEEKRYGGSGERSGAAGEPEVVGGGGFSFRIGEERAGAGEFRGELGGRGGENGEAPRGGRFERALAGEGGGSEGLGERRQARSRSGAG